MFACTVGGNRALLKASHKWVSPLSAPLLLISRPTIVPTTAPSRMHPSPPVATVIPVTATTATVAAAVIAILAATSSTPPRMSAIIEVWDSASPIRAAHNGSDIQVAHQEMASNDNELFINAQCAASASPSACAFT